MGVDILRYEGFYYYHACIMESDNSTMQLPYSSSSSNLSEKSRIRICICPSKRADHDGYLDIEEVYETCEALESGMPHINGRRALGVVFF